VNSLGLILGVVEKYLELCFLAHNLEAAALVPLSQKADGQKLEGA
jgi:hypothetical protein